MLNVMLIILRETVGCLSHQPWDICHITWPLCCVVHTVHLFIKHCSCVQSAYLSNNPCRSWNTVYFERS